MRKNWAAFLFLFLLLLGQSDHLFGEPTNDSRDPTQLPTPAEWYKSNYGRLGQINLDRDSVANLLFPALRAYSGTMVPVLLNFKKNGRIYFSFVEDIEGDGWGFVFGKSPSYGRLKKIPIYSARETSIGAIEGKDFKLSYLRTEGRQDLPIRLEGIFRSLSNQPVDDYLKQRDEVSLVSRIRATCKLLLGSRNNF